MFYVYTFANKYRVSLHCYLTTNSVSGVWACRTVNPHKQGDENEREDVELILPTQRRLYHTSKGCQGEGVCQTRTLQKTIPQRRTGDSHMRSTVTKEHHLDHVKTSEVSIAMCLFVCVLFSPSTLRCSAATLSPRISIIGNECFKHFRNSHGPKENIPFFFFFFFWRRDHSKVEEIEASQHKVFGWLNMALKTNMARGYVSAAMTQPWLKFREKKLVFNTQIWGH